MEQEHGRRIEYWYLKMMEPFFVGNHCCLIVRVGVAVVALVVVAVVLWTNIAGELMKQRNRLNRSVFGYMGGVILCRVVRIWDRCPGILADLSIGCMSFLPNVS